jgi:two-component system, NarL family, nitrate/nitrite response regulator NarL
MENFLRCVTDLKSERPSSGLQPARPRVFMLSGNRLLREAAALALADLGMIDIVGSSDTPTQFMLTGDVCPDVVLLDAATHGKPEMVIAARDSFEGVKIIAFGLEERDDVIVTCAKAGVSGFVTANASLEDLIAAVHATVRGELICSPRIAGILLSQVRKLAVQSHCSPKTLALTTREREIVVLMSEGLSNKQIARSIKVQNATVKNHVHSILGKLGVRSRCEAVAQFHQICDTTDDLQNDNVERRSSNYG